MTEHAEWQRDDHGRRQRAQGQQQVPLRLVREPRRVHGVLAHDREVVEIAGAECGKRCREEHAECRDTQPRAGPQTRQGIGGEQAERDQHDPESGAGRDAHDAIANGSQRARRRRHRDDQRHDADERGQQADARTLDEQGDGRGGGQREIQCERGSGYHVVQRARHTRHDAVRLEDDERQQGEGECPHDSQQRTQVIDALQPAWFPAQRFEPRPMKPWLRR